MALRKWIQRTLRRLRIDRSVHLSETLRAPTEQHAVLTDAQKFKRDHGYEMATEAAPWTEDITKHNNAVEREYQQVVAELKAAYDHGMYRPRFLLSDTIGDERMGEILTGARPTEDEINWDLEMTMHPIARANVTKSTLKPVLALLTKDDEAVARQIGHFHRLVNAEERKQSRRTVESVLGTREEILAACGGNEALADQVEAKARAEFGLEADDVVRD